MKYVLSILLTVAIFLQAAPVAAFLQEGDACSYVVTDEEAPNEKGKEVKDERADDKLSSHNAFSAITRLTPASLYWLHHSFLPPSPYLQQHTPPPNAC